MSSTSIVPPHEPAQLPAEADWIAHVRSEDRGFLRGLPDPALGALLQTARAIEVPRDRLLWAQGSTDRLVAWVAAGRLRIERDGAVIDVAQPGDVVGLSSLHDRPHSAAVRAIEDARLVVWAGASVRDALEASPCAAVQALGAVTERLRALEAELVLLRARAVATQRVAWHLLRMDRTGRPAIDLTHAELAQRIGIAPRVLHEALGALATARLIRLEPIRGGDEETISLEDTARLHAVAIGRETIAIP